MIWTVSMNGWAHPLLCPLSSSVTPRKLPSPWLPGFFRSAHRLPSTHPISRICTKSMEAADTGELSGCFLDHKLARSVQQSSWQSVSNFKCRRSLPDICNPVYYCERHFGETYVGERMGAGQARPCRHHTRVGTFQLRLPRRSAS